MGDESNVVELTEPQRRLVQDNLGLVGVHLRRSLGHVAHPRRDCEWDDLFQEGCLGLVQAAVRFREARGIPFAAFALPRIHNAVSRALQTKFSTVYVPPVRHSRISDASSGAVTCTVANRPRVHSLSDDIGQILPSRRHHPCRRGGETVGDRLRDKYERAVHAAVADVGRGPSRRGDLDRLARLLATERLLVPGDESRKALREIARETRSSYARVAQCDKKIADVVRARLSRDPEFAALSRLAQCHPDGTDRCMDIALDRELGAAASREFVRRLRRADPRERAQCVDMLVDCRDGAVDSFLRRRIQSLVPGERERLFHRLGIQAASPGEHGVNRRGTPDRP